MPGKAHLGAFILIAALTVVLLNLSTQTASRTKLALSTLFLPLFGLAGSAQTLADRAAGGVMSRRSLETEVERLKTENDRLKIEAMQTSQTRRENTQLRAALGWRQQTPWNAKLAQVTFRDPANWFRTLQINIGAREGVVTNSPVMTPEGLVGRVEAVGPHNSRVALIGDPRCQVAVVIDGSRDTGVITEGNAESLDDSIVQVNYLHRHATIMPGQAVSTSGLGGVFPKGIRVGAVIDTRSVRFGLYQEARIKLAADIRHLEDVWVVTP